jgi:hypothetical protein
MPLSSTVKYSTAVYTSDGAIICMGGSSKIIQYNWEILCFNTTNSTEITNKRMDAIGIEMDSVEGEHSLIVNINQTFLYLLSLDDLTFA